MNIHISDHFSKEGYTILCTKSGPSPGTIWGLTPRCFQHEGKPTNVAFRRMHYLMFFVEGEAVPYYYARNNDLVNTISGGIVRLGEGPLSVQIPGHCSDLADKPAPVGPYVKVSADPIIYERGSEAPFSRQTYCLNHAVFQETNVLDIRCDYWPVALFTHHGFMSNEYIASRSLCFS